MDEPIQAFKAKKEDPVKQGLEKLQEILPHLGSPGEEKVYIYTTVKEVGANNILWWDIQIFNYKWSFLGIL